MAEKTQSGWFKWVCLVAAIEFGFILLWMISDFKSKMIVSLGKAEATVSEVQDSVEKVNSQMPQVLSEIKETSSTLSGLAEDVELIKRVAGVGDGDQTRGVRGLALYADELQQLLDEKFEGRDGNVLLEEVIGSDLKKKETAEGFLVGLSKEMVLTILPLSNSKEEVLYRICHSGVRRKPFYIQFKNSEPQLLEDFIREQHPASRGLPKYQPKKK